MKRDGQHHWYGARSNDLYASFSSYNSYYYLFRIFGFGLLMAYCFPRGFIVFNDFYFAEKNDGAICMGYVWALVHRPSDFPLERSQKALLPKCIIVKWDVGEPSLSFQLNAIHRPKNANEI